MHETKKTPGEEYIALLENAKREYGEYLRITEPLKVLGTQEADIVDPHPTPQQPLTTSSN